MKRTAFILLAGLLVYSCNQHPTANMASAQVKQPVVVADTIRDGLFIHIMDGYNDPHKVLMALKMANLMAADKDVLVYMDIHAVELLVKGAKDMHFADFDSFQSYIKQLVDKKVGVYACPTCLKIAGFKPEDLMEGVQVAQKDKFFSFTRGRILSLDY